MTGTAPDGVVSSASWAAAPPPDVSVHVATYRRPDFLAGLIACFEAQTLDAARFEVVVVDDCSGDETWTVLTDLAARSRVRLAARRLARNQGPAGARNAAVAMSHGALLAFTDDDCLPSPGWLSELVTAAADADVVQGRTEPDPDPSGMRSGPWARTIRITGSTPLFETCNIAYRRAAFLAAGGFDEEHAVTSRPGGHAFGEDVLLGAAVVSSGGRHRYAPEALVHHRYLPASFRDHLGSMRELAGFPGLVRESAVLADALWARVFLTPRTASFDLGLLATVLAVVVRRPAFLVGVVPWATLTWPMTRAYGGRPGIVRLVQLGLADVFGAAALVRGSLRHRRIVL